MGSDGIEAIFGNRDKERMKPGKSGDIKGKLKKLGSAIGSLDGAHLEAIADFGRLIPALNDRRDSLVRGRKRSTSDLLELMGEPFRPVIGHPKEKEFLDAVGSYIREIIGGGAFEV